MSAPENTPVPTSVRTKVFRRVIRMLREHKHLRHPSAVKTWRVYDGSEDDQIEPTVSTTPHVTIKPGTLFAERFDASRNKSALSFNIVIVTSGLCADPAMDIWGAIEEAIADANGNDSFWKDLCELGVQRKSLMASQPIFEFEADAGANMVACAAEISVTLTTRA